jgi:hypothetical protein
MRLRIALLAPCLFLAAFPGRPAHAITDEEIFRNFRFNFANPGARALAMGGAFIALANDATAAQANPARLGILDRPEVFAEWRSRDAGPESRDPGEFQLDPSVNPQARADIFTSNTPESQSFPSVVSFVWPFKWRHPLTVGVSYQRLLDVESESTSSFDLIPVNSSVFQDPSCQQVIDPNVCEVFANDSLGSITARIDQFTLSGGYRLTRKLFLGGSVVVGSLDLESEQTTESRDVFQVTSLGGLDPRFQDPSGSPALLFRTTISDSDTAIGWSIGAFWQATDSLSFGTVYKKGVKMTVEEKVMLDPNGSLTHSVLRVPPLSSTSFNVPDLAGFGIAYQPFARSKSLHAQNLFFALDVVRVENEDLADDFLAGRNVLTNGTLIRGVRFAAESGTEIHLGSEYYFILGEAILALRAGFYTEPDDSIRLVEAGADVTPGTKGALLQGEGAFPEGDDKKHITGGIGFTFKDLEFAVAYDSSDAEDQDQALVSVIYRFK